MEKVNGNRMKVRCWGKIHLKVTRVQQKRNLSVITFISKKEHQLVRKKTLCMKDNH